MRLESNPREALLSRIDANPLKLVQPGWTI
jgi:hypothetical protein